MNTTNRPKAVAHCRVSSRKQAQEGESNDVQEEQALRLADSRGWEVVKVFREDYSGWKKGREVFDEIPGISIRDRQAQVFLDNFCSSAVTKSAEELFHSRAGCESY